MVDSLVEAPVSADSAVTDRAIEHLMNESPWEEA